MGEVLETWLRNRLGLIIDLSPEIFGLTTRDGTLLAQLLHSYDIIDNAQLNTIMATEDPALARVNLKHLRVWLKFIGVDCDDDTIEDISNGRGTTAARLFYKIFVSLESKDKLHFITQQKEREKFIPNSSKFDVTVVSERPSTPEPSESALAKQCIENASVIAWYGNKFQAISNRCKVAREKCLTMQEQRRTVQERPRENVDNEQHDVQANGLLLMEKEMQNLSNFSKKHKARNPGEYTYHELCNEKTLGEQMAQAPVDSQAAKMYVKCMKDRTRRAMEALECKIRMEKAVTAKLWETQRQDRETEFDLEIAKKLFCQSQYEKQMMSKLCEIRDQKRRIARNRGLVEKLMEERTRTENTMELVKKHEIKVKEGEDIEAECLRLCELHRRIYEEKIQNCKKRNDRMCQKVLDDIIDISIMAANYRESNDNFIPTKIWSEWTALFIKNQPIFDTVKHVEHIIDPNSEEATEEIFRAEIERQEILNDADFDNYLNVRPPWNEFMPEIDIETDEKLRLGIIVLGYIVHRLLEYIYPFKSDPEPAPMPKVSSACILLGVLDISVYPIMQMLLNHRGVKVILMEDAINYSLLCYKEEMKDVANIDLNTLRSKKEVQPKTMPGNASSRVKKDTAGKEQPKIPARTTKITTTMTHGIDEQTQTPRALPVDDISPDLSNPAYVGKCAHEILTIGQPLPNELTTKILVEYMKSLKDINGWVLLDYPKTFDQMAHLEMALTGIKIPLDNDQSSGDIDARIAEMNPVFSEVSYEAENVDEFSVFRESRLVCNPIPKVMNTTFNSYMTAYIRALPKPKNMDVHETDIYEILPEDATAIDAFYTDQGLAHAVYYTSFDMFTLKRLCRIVIGDMSFPRVPSEQLFGDGVDSLEDNKNQPPPSKAPIIKQLIPRPQLLSSDWGGESEYEDEGLDPFDTVIGSVDAEPVPPKPGEDGWEWIKFPQPAMLLEALATLWENMETVYIENLKEIFFMKRVHYSTIVPYRNYVAKHMNNFIQRPDTKQDMLHAFHVNYNDIAKDIREDLDVKCELHCRVADFQKELWEICDERRNQAEEERQRIIRQDWTAEEMIVLANLYITMIKAEIDRCIDTVQLIQDYYTSMLQKSIAVTRLPKYNLQRLESNSSELTASPSTLSASKASKPLKKMATSSISGKNMTSTGPQAAPSIDCSRMKKQIADLLVVTERDPLVPVQLTCYEAVHANCTYVQSIVDSLASSVFESLTKEQASFTTPRAKTGIQIPKAQSLPLANAELMTDVLKRGPDVYQEWRSAIQFEINRIHLRLKLLDNAVLSDINFLYETMERCFHNILKNINDRYNREIKSVNDMTSVFCFAIEEGVPIKEELLLDGDRFVVKSNVLMYPDDAMPAPEPRREEILPSQFRIGQLGYLMDVFRYVAPHGSLPERCFTYILEDMVTCGADEGIMAHLPSSWYGLRGSEISNLVTEILGDSEYVDWREFIIYALDIPMPSDEEILDARSQFIAMDPTLTEMVTRDEFHSVNMWFSNRDLKDHFCKNLLHEDYQKDKDQTYENEQEDSKTEKSSGFMLPNATPESTPSFVNTKSCNNSTFSFNSLNMTPQETVRLMLVKELLCDMFASGCDTINYTAFLLAFSKADDPREGLGKALTLAIGEKVCTSEEEGEKFIAELLERHHLAANNDEREAAEKTASSIINDVLKDTLDLTEGITISEIDNLHQCDSGQLIVSQPKQNTHSEYQEIGFSRKLQPDISLSSTSPLLGSRTSEGYETDQEISTTKSFTDGFSKKSLPTIGEPAVLVYWIPQEVCQSVLVASLPWHARQPDILGTTSCLRDCLENVYTDIFEPAITDEKNHVLSHRLVNHEFIINLLKSTTAFTTKNIGNIFKNVLNKRADLKQTSDC